MTIDELAAERGVTWMFILYEFNLWHESKRQKVQAKTFEEAVEEWSKRR